MKEKMMKINELLKYRNRNQNGILKIFKKSTTNQSIKYFFCKIPSFLMLFFTVISKR